MLKPDFSASLAETTHETALLREIDFKFLEYSCRIEKVIADNTQTGSSRNSGTFGNVSNPTLPELVRDEIASLNLGVKEILGGISFDSLTR